MLTLHRSVLIMFHHETFYENRHAKSDSMSFFTRAAKHRLGYIEKCASCRRHHSAPVFQVLRAHCRAARRTSGRQFDDPCQVDRHSVPYEGTNVTGRDELDTGRFLSYTHDYGGRSRDDTGDQVCQGWDWGRKHCVPRRVRELLASLHADHEVMGTSLEVCD